MTSNGGLTEYIYAADGTRLKRTVTVGANTTRSTYFGDVEIINSGTTDTTHWYLPPQSPCRRYWWEPLAVAQSPSWRLSGSLAGQCNEA